MRGRFSDVQALATALPVLECAVRHRSFTRAAAELGLTQPTVSRHVQAVEHWLGQPLFVRDHNRLEPTELARRLAVATEFGFGHIASVLADVAERPRRAVTLASNFTFANLWLMRRFADLRRAAAPVPLALKISFWMEDLADDDADVRLDWISAQASGEASVPLFPEIVYPVATPEVARRHGLDPDDAAPLAAAPLLFVEEREPNASWRKWFAAQGAEFAEPMGAYRHSGYPFMLHETLAGEGVGLGWHHLVAEDVDEGRLVRAGPTLVRPELRMTLGFRKGALPASTHAALIGWFRRETARYAAPPGVAPSNEEY